MKWCNWDTLIYCWTYFLLLERNSPQSLKLYYPCDKNNYSFCVLINRSSTKLPLSSFARDVESTATYIILRWCVENAIYKIYYECFVSLETEEIVVLLLSFQIRQPWVGPKSLTNMYNNFWIGSKYILYEQDETIPEVDC